MISACLSRLGRLIATAVEKVEISNATGTYEMSYDSVNGVYYFEVDATSLSLNTEYIYTIAAYDQVGNRAEQEIKVEKGQQLNVKELNILDKETSPPKRYTPTSIIKELEKLNLGTKATRHDIVDSLFDRNYLKRGKSIEVTDLGLSTVEVLDKYCPDILDAKLTREFEEDMEKITNMGDADPKHKCPTMKFFKAVILSPLFITIPLVMARQRSLPLQPLPSKTPKEKSKQLQKPNLKGRRTTCKQHRRPPVHLRP